MSRAPAPERMCAACREKKPKTSLWRIGLTQSDAVFDPAGKGSGRGMYVCRDSRCISALMKKKIRLPGHVLAQVRAICKDLLRQEDVHG